MTQFMSNPMFENPKVALGFSGGVLAVALVASVAFKEFSSSDDAAQDEVAAPPTVQDQAAPPPAQTSFASGAATGWADDGATDDDWGAPGASSQNSGFTEILGADNDAPVFGDRPSQSVSGGGSSPSNGPSITSSAAPGAPEVRPPEAGNAPEIQLKGN